MRGTTLLLAGMLAAAVAPLARAADADAPPPVPPPVVNDGPAAPPTPPTPPPAGDTKPAPPPPAAPTDPNALPTEAQIQALFDAGNYPETLKALSRVLPLKGKAAADYDRYKLTLLKAETHIRMKTPAPAMQALDNAADETDDAVAKANARATAQLIKRSKGMVFTPKPVKRTGKPPAPIDLTDPIARKAALLALYDEEMAAVAPKVKTALEETTLPPIATALKLAQGVQELELGATGSDATSKKMVTDLGAHGRGLITKAVEKMSKRVDEITKDANETVRIRVPVTSAGGVRSVQERVRRRGLKNGEDRELRDVIAQLPAVARSAAELIAATGGKKAEAQAMVEMCDELSKRAKKTLEADYSEF